MKILFFAVIFLCSLSAFGTVECSTSEHKFIVQNIKNELYISYKGETARADGILAVDEVDLIAKFKSIGEMTLFAKVAKLHPENYVFVQGKRFSVICR